MKHKLTNILGIVSLFMAMTTYVFAADITVEGRIVDRSCNLEVPANVPLGQYVKADINDSDDGLITATSFQINIKDCPTSLKEIYIETKGDFVNNFFLVNEGTAKNAYVAIIAESADGTEIGSPLSSFSKVPIPIVEGKNSVDVEASAMIYSPEKNVTAGTINTTAQFIIQYN